MALIHELEGLRAQLIAAAQAELDAWCPDASGWDEELGYGGACDRVAQVLAEHIAEFIPDVELLDGGQDGDDHAYVMVRRNTKDLWIIVDIPAHLYESGGGYTWRKREGVKLCPDALLLVPEPA